MNLFKEKSKLINICQNFYETEVILNPEYYNKAFSYVMKAPMNQKIEKELFLTEFMAIRLELFGLSFWHQIEKSLLDKNGMSENGYKELLKAVSSEILSIKTYLSNLPKIPKGVLLWESMKYYNSTLQNPLNDDEPVLLMPSLSFPSGFNREGTTKTFNRPKGNLSDLYSDIFPKFVSDNECVERLKNRANVGEDEWYKTSVSQLLVVKLSERLGITENIQWQTMFRFQQLIISVYKNASWYIYRFI
jgi:hypothetical protein